MTVEVTCAFATQLATPDHIAVAEQLGYTRAWCYDSPALYPDVWVQLCRAAEKTSTIGLGPGVLIPSLRHPMTTAAAIATLVDAAGAHRVQIGVGTGFTGRFTLGKKPLQAALDCGHMRAEAHLGCTRMITRRASTPTQQATAAAHQIQCIPQFSVRSRRDRVEICANLCRRTHKHIT